MVKNHMHPIIQSYEVVSTARLPNRAKNLDKIMSYFKGCPMKYQMFDKKVATCFAYLFEIIGIPSVALLLETGS
jgi:hypothetical protein